MYTHHFKMTAQPFCERAQLEMILRDERIEQGLARLAFFANNGDIAMLTGPTGVGKSTLLKLFVSDLPPNRHKCFYLHLTQVKSTSLLKLIVLAMGETPRMGKERVFSQILDYARNSDFQIILVIDEAHLLPDEAMTDLRLLLSSAFDDKPPLRLLLIGQENLPNRLKRIQHLDLLHRVTVRYQLSPFTREQTVAYIDHQLNKSGASDRLFDGEVKNHIHDCAHGLPRQINNISTICLLNAAARKQPKINERIFHDAIAEWQLS